MRITTGQLREIIKESLLLEAEDFSSKLKKIRMLLDKDDFEAAAKMYADMNENPSYIGGEIEALIFDYDETAGFFADADAEDAEEFEDLVYGYVNEKERGDHQNLPNKLEREVIGQALTQSFVLPADFKEIEFQVRMRGGKPYNINIEDDNTLSNIGPTDLRQAGVKIEDVIKVLRDYGARERKKQKPIRRTPPMYD